MELEKVNLHAEGEDLKKLKKAVGQLPGEIFMDVSPEDLEARLVSPDQIEVYPRQGIVLENFQIPVGVEQVKIGIRDHSVRFKYLGYNYCLQQQYQS